MAGAAPEGCAVCCRGAFFWCGPLARAAATRPAAVASSTARCRAGGEPMAGNAAADAALRLAVLRRGKMWTEEARKSESDLPPVGHPLGPCECVARQCAKTRLVTYQLKCTLFRSTYAPCCPVTGRVWSRDLVPRGARARTSHRPSRPRSIAKPSTSRPQIVPTLHFLYRRSCTEHMCGRQSLKIGMSPV